MAMRRSIRRADRGGKPRPGERRHAAAGCGPALALLLLLGACARAAPPPPAPPSGGGPGDLAGWWQRQETRETSERFWDGPREQRRALTRDQIEQWETQRDRRTGRTRWPF
jgi:hypothetical protein